MLTEKQVKEIRLHLEKAQNPLFFFDNDPDGLCSFLILQRYIGRGKGIPIKSFPELMPEYFRKIRELNADYVFILDKPLVSVGFFEEINKINIPVVWIDHHVTDNLIPDFVNYYNPTLNKKRTSEPVTALCYQISKKKEDLWISIIGSVSDGFIPENYKEFEKKYPDLSMKSKNALEIFYRTDVGKMARMMSFGLKDRTTNVINMIRFLIKAKNPYEFLHADLKNSFQKRFHQIDSKYQHLLKKAVALGKKQRKIIFFQYGGDLSMSSDIANELTYLFNNRNIAVVYIKGSKANISFRGNKIRTGFLKSIEGLEGATGGGHENAVGGQIKIEDIEKFRENLEKNLN